MYKDIIGEKVEENAGVEYATLAVLPKSGYVFVNNFLRTYDELLKDANYAVKTFFNWTVENQFDKKHFLAAHLECPGFHECVDSDTLTLWNSLRYSDFLPWTMPPKILSKSGELSPQHKLVFVFRNPLSQLLSYYFYMRKAEDTEAFDMRDFDDFIFNRNGLSSYLKLFLTFHVVRQKNPDHILLVPYEVMMRDKPRALKSTLNHLGIRYSEDAFCHAIELTSMENMKPLQDDMLKLRSQGRMHIRDGRIDTWQGRMNVDIVRRIEEEFNKFGLSLDMFYLADELEPKYRSLFSTPRTRRPVLLPF